VRRRAEHMLGASLGHLRTASHKRQPRRVARRWFRVCSGGGIDAADTAGHGVARALTAGGGPAAHQPRYRLCRPSPYYRGTSRPLCPLRTQPVGGGVVFSVDNSGSALPLDACRPFPAAALPHGHANADSGALSSSACVAILTCAERRRSAMAASRSEPRFARRRAREGGGGELGGALPVVATLRSAIDCGRP
jgi:hypothetical protein